MPYRDRGKWRGVVIIDGKRVSQKTDPSWTKRDAARWEDRERERLLKLSLGTDFLTFAAKYLDYAETKFSVKSYKEKRALVQRFAEFIEINLQTDEITVGKVHGYLMVQVQERSANAANKDRKNLHAMWEWGKRILDLPVNPVSKTDRFAHSRAPQYVPTESDMLKILAVCDAEERAFLMCYLCTGARRSEIFRLRWEDVNLEHRTITLTTKATREGTRKILVLPMNHALYDALSWHWDNRKQKDSPYVWPCENGPSRGESFLERRKFLGRLAKRAGVRAFGYHAIRRYVATYLSDVEKQSTRTIQRILGHSKETTTERYLYNIHGDLGDVMELLGNPSSPKLVETKETK